MTTTARVWIGGLPVLALGLLEANDIHNNGIAGFGRQPDSDSGALRDPPRTDGWLVRARPVHRQPHPFPQQPHRNEIYNGHQGGVFILGEGRGLIEHNNIYEQETRSQRVNDVHTLVHRLPPQNFNMLDIIIKHLTNVAAHSDKNLMSVSNLGVCFGPTLLRPEEETVAAIMDIKFYNVVVEILIENYTKIFKSDPEPSDGPGPPSGEMMTSRDRDIHSNSPTSPPLQSHVRHKYHNMQQTPPPVTHAVIKTYYDGPLSSSLHSVNSTSSQLRAESIYGTSHQALPMPNYQAHMTRIPGGPIPGAIHNNSYSTDANSTFHHSSPLHHHKALPSPFYYTTIGASSEVLNSTSSSNESVSSLSSRDTVPPQSHHNAFNAAAAAVAVASGLPQKSKRGASLGLHYPTSYRPPHDNVSLSVTSNSYSSGRSSPGFSQGIRRVRTLYACLGENDGELSFEPNQIITNVRTSLEPGWLEGTLNGKTGLVPENYVEVLP
ncbi:rho GTPase-activating protein 26 [Nilaparvata lugens]|uniref:rho GTPase-activating protein 26 n=1 Tax=Nilaparvata lugens TaxID=108931 RepID=UPI00193CB09D|nr:rho GTPase-activating protein 26 [Nilaparvata lugens]